MSFDMNPHDEDPHGECRHEIERLRDLNKTLCDALERLVSNRHCFMTSHEDKDTCAQCGENFRHGVHYRVGESAATDMEFARAAIKEAKGEL